MTLQNSVHEHFSTTVMTVHIQTTGQTSVQVENILKISMKHNWKRFYTDLKDRFGRVNLFLTVHMNKSCLFVINNEKKFFFNFSQ